MSPEENLKAGRLDEALAALHDAIRKAPADARLRIFLFQLLAVMGKWDKALTQLHVAGDMNPEHALLAKAFAPLLQCEAFRAEVFRGARTPLVFGEPQEWIGWLVHANQLAAGSQFKAARELRERAFEAAPASPGSLNGQPFAWLADADSRLGPVLEAILEGRYYWIPFSRIQSVSIQPPVDLRDLVWTAARFTWTNGGQAAGFIPVRYDGSELAAENSLRLSRNTQWIEKDEGFFVGLGQRLLATDQQEVPLLEVRDLTFSAPEAAHG